MKLGTKKGPWKGCADCGCKKGERSYYMVWDTVWEEGKGGRDVLCMSCLSDRLGRKLQRADFNEAPVNKAIFDVLNNVEG